MQPDAAMGSVTTLPPGFLDTQFDGVPRAADSSWMLSPEDLASTVGAFSVPGTAPTSAASRCARLALRNADFTPFCPA